MGIEDPKYCLFCGSKLGIDCGDAEPDYNEDYCSFHCFKIMQVLSSEQRAHHRALWEVFLESKESS